MFFLEGAMERHDLTSSQDSLRGLSSVLVLNVEIIVIICKSGLINFINTSFIRTSLFF